MKAVIQRVSEASVTIVQSTVGAIEYGLLVFLGVTHDDTTEDADYLVRKITQLRIFEDDQARMNLNIRAVGGEILSISQFTLYADTKKGNRPSFVAAAKPQLAEELYEYFNKELENQQINVATGVFGADMKVCLVNDGPVTITIDSKQR